MKSNLRRITQVRIIAAVGVMAFLASGCASIRHARTAELIRARSQAEDGVRFIKHNFRSRDLEYAKVEELYGELRSDYECWLQGLKDAIADGKDPNAEARLLGCANDAPRRRDDFVDFVRSVASAPRRDPATNQMKTLSGSTTVADYIAAGTQVLTLFDRLLESATKYHEWSQKVVASERAKELARLDELHWKKFDEIN